MSRWFKFYDCVLDDPKVQRLPKDVAWGWVNILCLASRNDGRLPSIPDIAFALRLSDREAESLVSALMAAGLLDDVGEHMEPHNWPERQNVDRTAAERMRNFRARKANKQPVTSPLRVTPVTVTAVEKRREEEKREEKKEKTRGSAQAPRDELLKVLSEEMSDAIIEHRARLKAPLTARAAKSLAAKLSQCTNPEAGASLMLERGWKGFEPEWMTSLSPSGQPSRVQAFWGDTFKKVVA